MINGVFCRNKDWLMEGHKLGTRIDKMFADSSTGTTPTTPQSIQPFFPNLPIIWDIFKKTSPHHMSIVHGKRHPQTFCLNKNNEMWCWFTTNLIYFWIMAWSFGIMKTINIYLLQFYVAFNSASVLIPRHRQSSP